MKRLLMPLVLALVLTSGAALAPWQAHPVAAATDPSCVTFTETGHDLCGRFLAYWQDHGGLAQQGFPVSDLFQEQSATDGRTYQVQYFERAVFEYHPELPGDNKILLSQVGRDALKTRYPNGVVPAPGPALAPALTGECATFDETNQNVCGAFLTYWQKNGGLAQQGFPLSPVFNEVSKANGQTYQVQYFERAVFEYHPENPAPNDVLLSQLGRSRYASRYPNGPGTLDTEFVSISNITLKTVTENYVDWSLQVRNISDQQLLSVLITLVFLDANGNQLDTSIGGATNMNPNETRTIHGISIKGIGYAQYRLLTPETLLKP
jgi:hypothetical protein